MAQSKAAYHPLNGKEIREILKRDICKKIDLIPMLKEGNAFDEARLAYSFTMTCIPADCPVPTAEWEVAARNPGFNLQDNYIDRNQKAQALRDLKEKLELQIEKIDELLSANENVSEIVIGELEEDEIISAGRVPDQTRIDYELQVPRIVKTTGVDGNVSMSEKYIDYNKL